MNRPDFIKLGAPIWFHVPGTPFTLPGTVPQYERLPGMSEWADREVVTRVNKDLEKGTPIKDIEANEANRDLSTHLLRKGIGGGIAGSLAGRVAGGEAATAKFKDILQSGVSKETLRNLKKTPTAMKALPLLGLGGGLAAGLGSWASSRDQRRQQARDVSKGLLAEQVLQNKDLMDTWKDVQQPNTLAPAPVESATQETPLVTTLGSTGA